MLAGYTPMVLLYPTATCISLECRDKKAADGPGHAGSHLEDVPTSPVQDRGSGDKSALASSVVLAKIDTEGGIGKVGFGMLFRWR